MNINDKLKGSYYRAPMTKLASRRNVVNKLNELIDYFNNISKRLDECFNRITDDRERMKSNLLTVYEEILHFKYLLEHFHYEIDLHINEKLNSIIDSFTTNISDYIAKYDTNFFNHSTQTDESINNQPVADTFDEWDRSVNAISNSLGIRWFGGKLKDSDVLNKLSNILHITKINTHDGTVNDDYIKSNLILELFIYTNKGMAWLVLGQDSTFGYNMITKYISPEMSNMNIKLVSEVRNSQKSYNLNVVDMDMIISDIIGNNVDNNDVYIKVCTNIPANSESGKGAYYLSSDPKFNNFEVKKKLINFGKGLLYRDNKDVEYYKRKNNTLEDIQSKNFAKIYTPNLLSPSVDKPSSILSDNKIKSYYEEIDFVKNNSAIDVQSKIINPNGNEIKRISDKVNGIVIDNSRTVINNDYFEKNKLNEEIKKEPELFKGDQNVDLKNYKTTGIVSILNQNEVTLKAENSVSQLASFIENDKQYNSGNKDLVLMNKVINRSIKERNIDLSKNENFEELTEITNVNIQSIFKNDKISLIGSEDALYYIKKGDTNFRLVANNIKVYAFIEYNDKIYVGTENGIYVYNSNENKLIQSYTDSLNDGFIYFYKGNDNHLYAFRNKKETDIYKRNDGKESIKEFLYILYDNNWYEVNKFAVSILNLPGTGIDYSFGSFGDVAPLLVNLEKIDDYNYLKIEYDFENDKGYLLTSNGLLTFKNEKIKNILLSFGYFEKYENPTSTNNKMDIVKQNDKILLLTSKIGNKSLTTVSNKYNFRFLRIKSIKNKVLFGFQPYNGVVGGSITNGYIYYSKDNGETWTLINCNSNSFTPDFLDNLIVTKDGTLITYMTSYGAYYSIDDGIQWYKASTDESFNVGCIITTLSGMLMAPNCTYPPTGNCNYYISKDNGKSWNGIWITDIYNDNEVINYMSIAEDGTIIAYCTNYKWYKNTKCETTSYIWYSEDEGNTWTKCDYHETHIFENTNVRNYYRDNKEISNVININNRIFAIRYISSTTIILYSDDNGRTWTLNEFSNTGINKIIHSSKTDSNKLIAYYRTEYMSVKSKLYYSEDNGTTWNDILPSNNPLNSGDYYIEKIILTQDDILVAATNVGIWYSRDNGKTWTKSDLVTGNIYYLEERNGIFILFESNKGIWYSEDNCKTWIQSDLTHNNLTSGSIRCITLAQDGTLVAGGKNYKDGIYYSIDNGKTWTQSSLTFGYILCIILAQNGTLLAGTYDDGIYYSEDNGKTWVGSNITDGLIYYITLAQDGTLLTSVSGGNGNNNGIYYSIDNGKTWTKSNLTSGSIRYITLAQDGTLLAGTYDGIYYSIDNGKTWTKSNLTSGSIRCITLAQDGTLVAGCDSSKGIYYSEDNGKTWTQSNLTSGRFNCITLAQDGTLVAGSSNSTGVYYSNDNGKTWTQSNITNSHFDIIISAQDGTLVACSTIGSNIYYSEDNGKTWDRSNITYGYIGSITLAQDGTLVVGLYNSGSDTNGIYYSEDNGKTWTQSNISNDDISCITLVQDGTLVAGTYDGSGTGKYTNGIYYSEDNGKTWNRSKLTIGSHCCLIEYNNNTLIMISFEKYNNGSWYSKDNGKTWAIIDNANSITDSNIVWSSSIRDSTGHTTGIPSPDPVYYKGIDGLYIITPLGNSFYFSNFSKQTFGIIDNSEIQSNKWVVTRNNKIINTGIKVLKSVDDFFKFDEVEIDSIKGTNFKTKLINGILYFIPDNDDVKDIVYIDNNYYILTKNKTVIKISNEMKIETIYHLNKDVKSMIILNDIILFITYDNTIYTTKEFIEKNSDINYIISEDDSIICTNILNK